MVLLSQSTLFATDCTKMFAYSERLLAQSKEVFTFGDFSDILNPFDRFIKWMSELSYKDDIFLFVDKDSKCKIRGINE